jgi:hypothetical protein
MPPYKRKYSRPINSKCRAVNPSIDRLVHAFFFDSCGEVKVFSAAKTDNSNSCYLAHALRGIIILSGQAPFTA